jgi:preprotein translocase subunit YajC
MSQPLIAALLALTPPAPNADPNAQKQQMIYQIGMIVVMGVVFWVLLIRPQQKRAKEQAALLSNLKAGDRVTTSSGIVGSVVSIKEHTVTVRSADTKLEVVKSSIAQVLQGSEAPTSGTEPR